jgi:tetratricopeptide (TPR) repeat protein
MHVRIFKTILYFLIVLNTYHQCLWAYTAPTKIQAPLFDNLGSFHHPVSTQVSLAQRFFDQGLVLYYGFEWGESIRSFREAARLDPSCGMCYWGIALGLGSKINAPLSGHEYQEAKTAIEKAQFLKKYETSVEQDYIKALSLRFQHKPKKIKVSGAGTFSCHISNEITDASSKKEILAYSDAMSHFIKKYPSDYDARALYTYTLFESIEWKFRDAKGIVNPLTPTMISVLKSVLAKEPLHIGANHLLIHVIESSTKPQEALASAERLKSLVPGSEHLVHMPTHIYYLTGRYQHATEANLAAIAAFKLYNKTCLQQGFEPEINYLYFHNYDFLRTSAMMQGRSKLALSTVKEMLDKPFGSWLANEPALQWFIPIPYFVEARFGLWKDLLNKTEPITKYQYALGMWHYARGLAFAHTHKEKNAEKELASLKEIIQKGPTDSNLQKNGINLLKIANAVLTATLADLKGDEQTTLAQLKAAVKIQHDMGYHEPPDWYFPVKEALGNAYLKWNHPAKAAAMFQNVLHQYPQDGWALYGLANALKKLGKDKEAMSTQQEFRNAWVQADIPVPVFLFH